MLIQSRLFKEEYDDFFYARSSNIIVVSQRPGATECSVCDRTEKYYFVSATVTRFYYIFCAPIMNAKSVPSFFRFLIISKHKKVLYFLFLSILLFIFCGQPILIIHFHFSIISYLIVVSHKKIK